ncbi:MAG: pentapeptide repeat-containing protein [Hyphomicrobiaceae bacterium]
MNFVRAISEESIFFNIATIGGRAAFNLAQFKKDANFYGVSFNAYTSFPGVMFAEEVLFDSAKFLARTNFQDAVFGDASSFHKATFAGDAIFTSVLFEGNSSFSGAKFKAHASFRHAKFKKDAAFNRAKYVGDVDFDFARFFDRAEFYRADFQDLASFINVRIAGAAVFTSAEFQGGAGFAGAIFHRAVRFVTATFAGMTVFERASFNDIAQFVAIKSDRAFSLQAAEFHHVPDFNQADFAESPRLDDCHIYGDCIQPRRVWLPQSAVASAARPAFRLVRSVFPRLPRPAQMRLVRLLIEPEVFALATEEAARRLWVRHRRADRDLPARWRSLRRLAIQAHDYDLEHYFHAREIRARRFAGDWFLPFVFWTATAWRGFARFWFGLIYGWIGGFGRATVRPLLLWLLLVFYFSGVYVGGMPEMRRLAPQVYETDKMHAWGVRHVLAVTRPVRLGWHAWDREISCTSPDPGSNFVGLKPELAHQTNGYWEALRMSLSNAVVFGTIGNAESARLTYGCLYGLERIEPAGTRDEGRRYWATTTYLPPDMVSATRWQKFLSAILIFLFGLSLRNMLKMR